MLQCCQHGRHCLKMLWFFWFFTHFPTFCIPIFINFLCFQPTSRTSMQWGSLPYMPSLALAPAAAPHPAGDGDDGAQTWKQLTQAQTCCWSNLITHIMCHYWAGAGSTNTAPTTYPEYPVSTQGLHSPHVTSHVHPNLLKQTIHYNRRMSEYRPVIFISSWRFHVQFTSPRTTWGWSPPTGQLYGSWLVLSVFLFFCHASEIPVSAFGQLPKVLLPQLSVRSGAVIKCDSWYCVSPSCPRILPAACTPQPHPGYSLQWDAFCDEKVMNVFRKLLIRSP